MGVRQQKNHALGLAEQVCAEDNTDSGKLPYLATYLGHKDIRSTLVYLNITPELLQEAGERFRKNGAMAVQTTEDAL